MDFDQWKYSMRSIPWISASKAVSGAKPPPAQHGWWTALQKGILDVGYHSNMSLLPQVYIDKASYVNIDPS
jgi:hypothetical protein